jgi:DNA-binding SARP family transcriptional activator
MSVQLLGPPLIRDANGEARSPRDRKTWGTLAYLYVVDRPPPRQRLAELLFPDVDDPLAAVRWVLASIRRLLGGDVAGGDPVELRLAPGTVVDVDVVSRGRWAEAAACPTLGRDLLEGISFDSLPGFDLWLTSERRRLRCKAAAVLREAALANLSRDPERAVEFAERLVAADPFDENHHVVLVQAMVADARTEDAAQHVDSCETFLRNELGVSPTGALRGALTPIPQAPLWVVTRTSVLAQLEAAEASMAAGSLADGVDRFRRAVANARALDAPDVLARCLIGLGSALVHAARGHDEEGTPSLHEGGVLAEQHNESVLAATAWRELAWVEFLRARHDRAFLWLDRAVAMGPDPTEAMWIALVSGAARTDLGDYATAMSDLTTAVDVADRANLIGPGAFARAFLGRLLLLRGELDGAADVLTLAIEHAKRAAWTSMIPWPESLLAEIHLLRGDDGAAQDMFEHAYTIGRQIGDPCWESLGARGLGRVAAHRGDLDQALPLLENAPRICRRLPDTYLWIEAYGLDALCAIAVDHDLASAPHWAAELQRVSDSAGFRELKVRALLYRARLGEPGALSAAQAAADGFDNPVLASEIASSPAG